MVWPLAVAKKTWNVVHVIDSLGGSGGAEQQLVANLSHFADPRLHHDVLCLYPGAENRRHELPPSVGLSFASRRRQRNRVVQALLVTRRLKEMSPDLICSTLPDAGLAARVAGRWLGVPVVESLVNVSHDPVHQTDNPTVKGWKLWAHRQLDRLTMRYVTAFHAISEEVARSWIGAIGLREELVAVIPRGVDLREVVPEPERKRRRLDTRSELGIEGQALMIVNLGRQVPQKGQIYAIEAMPEILAFAPKAILVSAGSQGSMTTRLTRRAAELGVSGAVRWLGIRKDVPSLFAAADVFLFPSLYEGLGVSLLQAMAAGLPCIATDRPPMSEVITDLHDGLLVAPADPAAIAAAVLRLVKDPGFGAALGHEARATVVDRYQITAIAPRLESLYLQALSQTSP